ncbi:MAG: hypothetical protein GY714_03700 [Desulfobacterales bacterium]|nr:hypothetical protein [Desulfobacterales bacterium]
MKNFKIVSVLFISLLIVSCGSLKEHHGFIPKNIDIQEHNYLKGYDKKDFAEIICAKGGTQFYFIGWATPELKIKFDDEGKSESAFYESMRLIPEVRDFTLKFTYRRQHASYKIDGFTFEPNTKYFAKYETSHGRVKVWIEKKDGSVVYGSKPQEELEEPDEQHID